MDISSPEGHSSGRPLPVFLPVVDPGDLPGHLSAAALPLPAPRSARLTAQLELVSVRSLTSDTEHAQSSAYRHRTTVYLIS